MNGITGSSKFSRTTFVERESLNEALVNFALVQREQTFAYRIGDCADRQVILERWVLSQNILSYVDRAYEYLRTRELLLEAKDWREGYNSPSSSGLDDIPEDLEFENSKVREDPKFQSTTITKSGRGGYQLEK
jgi:hypothetical protein